MKKFEHKYFLPKEVLIFLTRTSRKRNLGRALGRLAVASFSLLCLKNILTQKCQKNITKVLIISFLTFTLGCPLNGSYEKLINDLNSENIIVLNNAVVSLGEDQEKKAVPMLIELLKSTELREFKINIVKALGKISENSSVDILIKILKEKDKELRIAAIEALGKIKDPKAIPYLINNVEDKDVQLVTIWALGAIGDKRASAVLAKLLDGKDKYVRYNAIRSLESIGKNK